MGKPVKEGENAETEEMVANGIKVSTLSQGWRIKSQMRLGEGQAPWGLRSPSLLQDTRSSWRDFFASSTLRPLRARERKGWAPWNAA
jgi:hypothetical protein